MSIRSHYDPIHDIVKGDSQREESKIEDPNTKQNFTSTSSSNRISDLIDSSSGQSVVENVPHKPSVEKVTTRVGISSLLGTATGPNVVTQPTNVFTRPALAFATTTEPEEDKTASTLLEKLAKKRTNQTLIISAKQHHIKKKDGEPLWRKDIQFDFLLEVFQNSDKAFTNPYSTTGDKVSFMELYILTMAQSPKTSRILKDRLLTDQHMSIPVAMVSLLVNVGRMNTTINFVPEMKSQLRTYHSIPSLQCSSKNHIKVLQDTPRLKSILKSCSEYEGEPNNFFELFHKQGQIKTNVVNLIFMLCSYELLIFSHFNPESIKTGTNKNLTAESTIKDMSLEVLDLTNPKEAPFSCIFLNFRLTPKSRAQRFLWLLYNYLETDLSEAQISANPFGDPAHPLDMPELISVLEGEEFDKDTADELEFGNMMVEQRRKFLVQDAVEEPANHEEEDKSDKKNKNKKYKVLKISKADKKKIEHGLSKLKELRPEDVFANIFQQQKEKFKKGRLAHGNVKYLNNIKDAHASHHGDFGEFSSTCAKVFKGSTHSYEKGFLNKRQKPKVNIETDSNTIVSFKLDIQ